MTPSLVDLAKDTKLVDLQEFLRLLGWAPIEHPNSRLQVYRKADGSVPLEVVLPRTSEVVDFGVRVAETVQTLALFLKQAPGAILAQINGMSEDVLRARVLASETQRSSIPLDMAVTVIAGLKKLLTYSATGEASPLPFYSLPTKKAVAHSDRCRFGHTFAGSFGFTIESPIAPQLQDSLIAEVAVPPFERRVMERLYRGLTQLKQATDAHDLAEIVTNYTTGLSANMCDALLEITGEANDREVAFAVDWSPKIPEDRELVRGFSDILIGPASVEYLHAASKQLRRLEELRPLTIEGRVVLLKSDSQPWEDEPDDPHTVVVAWIDTDGKLVKTRVVLAPADYLAACNAHLQGLTVAVSGTLERRGKYTRLFNPTSFGLGQQGVLPINPSNAM
jgi:hypothetical protein